MFLGLSLHQIQGKSVDLACVDVRNGEREGVRALVGRTSLICDGGTTNYKRAALMRQDELEELKLYFQEMRENRRQGVGD